jgi:uncharacterized protein (TIGR02594 family)
MSNLKISRLSLVLFVLLFVSSTDAFATIREGKAATCYTTNIQHTQNCRNKKLITHTKKPASKKIVVKKVVIEPASTTTSVPSPKSSVYMEAARYVGLTERKHTQSLAALTGVNPRRTPWCAAFVNAILNRNGYQTTGSNTASSFSSYGIKVRVASRGDIVLIRSRVSSSGRHVGIFYEYKVINGVKHIGVLGGNQNNMVKVTYYPVRSVITIRRPIA